MLDEIEEETIFEHRIQERIERRMNLFPNATIEEIEYAISKLDLIMKLVFTSLNPLDGSVAKSFKEVKEELYVSSNKKYTFGDIYRINIEAINYIRNIIKTMPEDEKYIINSEREEKELVIERKITVTPLFPNINKEKLEELSKVLNHNELVVFKLICPLDGTRPLQAYEISQKYKIPQKKVVEIKNAVIRKINNAFNGVVEEIVKPKNLEEVEKTEILQELPEEGLKILQEEETKPKIKEAQKSWYKARTIEDIKREQKILRMTKIDTILTRFAGYSKEEIMIAVAILEKKYPSKNYHRIFMLRYPLDGANKATYKELSYMFNIPAGSIFAVVEKAVDEIKLILYEIKTKKTKNFNIGFVDKDRENVKKLIGTLGNSYEAIVLLFRLGYINNQYYTIEEISKVLYITEEEVKKLISNAQELLREAKNKETLNMMINYTEKVIG